MAISSQEIRDFVAAKGIGNDPYAIANYAKQYGVSDNQVADAMGYTQDQVNRFRGNLWGFNENRARGPATNEDVQRTMGGGVDFSAATPHKAFAAAQLNKWSPEQTDSALGLAPGTSGQWAKQQGLQWGGWNQAPQSMQPNGSNLGMPAPMTGGPTPGTTGGPAMTGGANPGLAGGPGNPGRPMTGGPTPGLAGGSQMTGMAQPFGQMNGNPYLNGMANNLARTATSTLQRQILPGIRGQAVAAGGVGGSRQGVAEGLAVGGTMDALGGALTNLYGNAYGQDQQYDLANQRLGLDTYNSNQNWMRLGQNDQLNALNTMLGWQAQGLNLANQQQNTPMNYWQQFSNTGSQLGGMGASNTQTLQGNPWLGALGGMQLGTKLFGG